MRVIETPSPNHGERRHGGPVDMLVLHYTGMESAEAALTRLTNPAAEVSAHYLVEEDGTLHRLVPEERRAWHAGRAYWRGIEDVNSHSIGIELVNPGHEFGYRPFPDAQIDRLIALCQEILARHPIDPAGIVGHSDIAPDRKTDPGELFPWSTLAEAGIGLYPPHGLATESSLNDLLSAIGYDPSADQRIAAFQRRFRPQQIDNAQDRDCTERAAAYLHALETYHR